MVVKQKKKILKYKLKIIMHKGSSTHQMSTDKKLY